MKLLTKTAIVYLCMTLVLFSVGGILFYYSLRSIIDENISENLEQTRDQVLVYAKKNGSLPAQSSVGSDVLIFTPADISVKEEIKDTVLYSSYEKESLPYRELVFPVKTNEGIFTAIAGKPILESDDLIESVIDSLGIVAGALLIILFLSNWILSKVLWKPFYKTLAGLKAFDIGKKEAVNFPVAGTSEFKMLNEALEKMTDKIIRDYRNLKEFTENASHEIQTPLAIIRSKLELMIQSENIPQEQMKMIQDIYESANRLSKLNQSLLLLAKIENRQFHETQSVNLKDLIEKKLDLFEDMISFKNITVDKQMVSSDVKMNPHLADILLSNIIGNAIRHNLSGGKISIDLKNDSLSVSNTGNPLEIPSEKMFERFQKSGSSPESVGLGLSIVKQICETYNFRLNYSHARGVHTISVSF
jgi:signal transduction histidine kinase